MAIGKWDPMYTGRRAALLPNDGERERGEGQSGVRDIGKVGLMLSTTSATTDWSLSAYRQSPPQFVEVW